MLRTGGRAYPAPTSGTDTDAKGQSVPSLGNLT